MIRFCEYQRESLTKNDKKLIVKLRLCGKSVEEIQQMIGLDKLDVDGVITSFLAPEYSPFYEGD